MVVNISSALRLRNSLDPRVTILLLPPCVRANLIIPLKTVFKCHIVRKLKFTMYESLAYNMKIF